MTDHTDQTSGANQSFGPLTWTLDEERVMFVWRETAEVFDNKMWHESVTYGTRVFRAEWQDELRRRSGKDLFSFVLDSLGKVRFRAPIPDPSLVFLALKDAFSEYGVTLELSPHPWHGDVIARARELKAAGTERFAYGPATWTIDEKEVVRLWDDVESRGPEEAFSNVLGDSVEGQRRRDELALRSTVQASVVFYGATEDVQAEFAAMEEQIEEFLFMDDVDEDDAPNMPDPSLAFLAVHEYCKDPDNGNVTFEFAAHPRHGDVLERARRFRNGRAE